MMINDDTIALMLALCEYNDACEARKAALATLDMLDHVHAVSDASIATLDSLDARFDSDPIEAYLISK